MPYHCGTFPQRGTCGIGSTGTCCGSSSGFCSCVHTCHTPTLAWWSSWRNPGRDRATRKVTFNFIYNLLGRSKHPDLSLLMSLCSLSLNDSPRFKKNYFTVQRDFIYSVYTSSFYLSLPNHATKHVFDHKFKLFLTMLLASHSLWFSEPSVLNCMGRLDLVTLACKCSIMYSLYKKKIFTMLYNC